MVANEGLSFKEKLRLRELRFKGSEMVTTSQMRGQLEEERQKRIERAQKFGLESDELIHQKRQERQKKFNLPTSSPLTPQDYQRKLELRKDKFATNNED